MPTIPVADLVEVLTGKGVTEMYHANTVMTSLSFVTKADGLLSRGAMERAGYPQTPQKTDEKDKQLRIWDYVFIDALDIHDRLKTANFYGPVMFVYDLKALLSASVEAVAVTRSNPSNWTRGERENQRWFSLDELKRRFVPRDSYNSSLVLKCVGGRLPFADGLKRIVLDDPKQALPDVAPSSFDHAASLLVGTGKEVVRRVCPVNCVCASQYRGMANLERNKYHKMFDPSGSRTAKHTHKNSQRTDSST